MRKPAADLDTIAGSHHASPRRQGQPGVTKSVSKKRSSFSAHEKKAFDREVRKGTAKVAKKSALKASSPKPSAPFAAFLRVLRG
jgi:hypothetical protein